MLSTARLLDGLVGDRVVIDRHGNQLDIEVPAGLGPAALLVTSLTDAVKRVESGAVESLDRDQLWVVDAIVLSGVVVQDLEVGELSAEDLLAAVRDAGYSWEISPISSP